MTNVGVTGAADKIGSVLVEGFAGQYETPRSEAQS